MKKLAPLMLALLAACGGGAGDGETAPEPAEKKAEAAPAAASGPFEFRVMDAFAISGRDGDIVTGKVASGSVSVGDTVCLVTGQTGSNTYVVDGIEQLRKLIETANAGQMAGIGLKGFDYKTLQKGDKVTLRGGAC
jgi:translation elongation factor EF-Tu-like GTPase